MLRNAVLTGTLLLIGTGVFGQRLFNNEYTNYNPAFAGMYDFKSISFVTSQSNSEFKQNYYSNGKLSFVMPLKKISSGVGFHAGYNEIGFSSILDLGVMYSFRYNIGNDFSIAAGSNFSLHKERLDGIFMYPDGMNDYIHFNEQVFLFNIDVGIWIRFKNLQLGVTNQHINSPSRHVSLDEEAISISLKSNFNTILGYDFKLGQKLRLKNSLIIPSISQFTDSKFFMLNNILEINNTYLIGFTTDLSKYHEISGYISPNLGVNLADKFRFIMSANLIRINTNRSSINVLDGVFIFNF